MESHALRPYIVVVFLMAMTSVLLALSVDVSVSNEAGIRMVLPDAIGDWTGDEIRYCHSPGHRQDYLLSTLEDIEHCPECGEPLYTLSKIEADILPDDTGMLKKHYVHPSGSVFNASIVLSGKERGSIHRPEVCQTGQGRNLVNKQVIEVPIEGRKPLRVMVLELEHAVKNADGQKNVIGSYYAYWFVGKDRETPYHHMRMFWMAADRVMRNIAHRWAYISVAGTRRIGTDEHLQDIRDVVTELYPHMVLGRGL